VVDGDAVEHFVLASLAAGAAVFLYREGAPPGGIEGLGRSTQRPLRRHRQRQGEGEDGKGVRDVAYRLIERPAGPGPGPGPGPGRVVTTADALVLSTADHLLRLTDAERRELRAAAQVSPYLGPY
jgi:hypothetical protein